MTIQLFQTKETDAILVEGVYKKEKKIISKFYNKCREYFEKHYMAIFIVQHADMEDIFQSSIITLWEYIDNRRIYVKNGVIIGKDGLPFKPTLTTFLMSIAKFKYKELVRSKNNTYLCVDSSKYPEIPDYSEIQRLLNSTKEDIQMEAISQCLSSMSEGCREILTKFYLEGKKLDILMIELDEYNSKDALKTRKNKCMKSLRECSANLYNQFRYS